MNITMVGAGNIGGNLARLFVKAGHSVVLSNSRGPATLQDMAAEIGAGAASVADAVEGAEVVVITIPLKNVPDLPPGLLKSAAPDVVVIDTNNYYPQQRDGLIAEIESGTTESRWVADQLQHGVVKVFNGIYAKHLLTHGRPSADPKRIALPVAGDDPAAKAVVKKLLDEIGFDAVDAGGTDDSWRQQPGQPAYGAETDVAGMAKLLSEANQARTAEWRA